MTTNTRTFLFLIAALISSLHIMAEGPRKTIAILGDSYSTFEGYVEPVTNELWYFDSGRDYTDVNDVRQTWWHRLIKEGGYKLGVNNSYSGATICRTGYRGEDYTDRAFITRMNDLGNPDIILVFGATNDSWAKVPVGEFEYSAWTPESLYAFRPAMARLLDGLQTRYPNVEIHFILNDILSPEITGSVKTICAHYGINCIELKDIDKKSGHPSVKGMEQIADQVSSHLSSGNLK